MADHLPEPPEPSAEYQNFERVVKAAFATPKEQIDAAIKEEGKKARRRVAVKKAAPTK